jgi:hypothetical protein
MSNQQKTASERMMDFYYGFWVARALTTAAKLGIADVLASGPKTVEQLATATKAHAPSLYRLLRALASVGVFRERAPGEFESTPLGDTLRSNVPGSMRYTFITGIGEEHYDAWAGITHSVRTGETAFDHILQMPIWKFYQEHEENGRSFNQFMTDLTSVVDPAVLEAYDFGQFKHVIDVGGGHGRLLAEILRKHPALRGTVFDQPDVVQGARTAMARANLGSRCDCVGGDFFESVPAGGDGYMMKFIIHDWDDQRSIRILKNIRKVIAPKGKLLLVECTLSEANDQPFGKFMDLNMLVMTGGRERTGKEYTDLLRAGGFELTRVVPTESVFSIVEASPA